MSSEGKCDIWLEERHQGSYSQKFKVEELLFSQRTEFQQVDIVKTAGHGKMLLNDGLVMVSERDEFIYHEMIAHVPLFTHPFPQRVLVIGGGDGGTVREVVRHPSVEYCCMVEIDGVVVEACKEHLPQTAISLDDERVNLVIGDGVKYVAEAEEKFDIVIVDSTDPIGPAVPLFGRDFYKNVYRVLNDDGIVVSQAEDSFYSLDIQKSLLKTVSSIFPKLFVYNYSNLTYPGGFWSLSLASKKHSPLADFKDSRVEKSGLDFGYYSPDVHRASFALPQFSKLALAEFLSV